MAVGLVTHPPLGRGKVGAEEQWIEHCAKVTVDIPRARSKNGIRNGAICTKMALVQGWVLSLRDGKSPLCNPPSHSCKAPGNILDVSLGQVEAGSKTVEA